MMNGFDPDLYRQLLDRLSPEDRMSLEEVTSKPPPEPGKTPLPDRMVAVSHLMDGVTMNLNHTARHLLALKDIPADDTDRMKYGIDHLENHLAESVDHAVRLQAALAAYFPEIGSELDQLHAVTDPASREYERGAAEVRKRWRGDLMYDGDGDGSGWRTSAHADEARRY